MARTYTMTPARRAALRKAQEASARKRRGKGKGKLAAANRKYDARQRRNANIAKSVGLAVQLGVVGGFAYADHKSTKRMKVEYARRNNPAKFSSGPGGVTVRGKVEPTRHLGAGKGRRSTIRSRQMARRWIKNAQKGFPR